MTNRSIAATLLLIVFPLGLATGLLAAHTIGESISPSSAGGVGFAVGLLAAVSAVYVLLFTNAGETGDVRFGIVLVACGTACILLALALQFYLAWLAGENNRRLAEMLADGLRRGERLNANLNWYTPDTVKGIGYLSLFAGIWLAAMGIRLGVGRGRSAPAAVATARQAVVAEFEDNPPPRDPGHFRAGYPT
jgi:hypothetical protein